MKQKILKTIEIILTVLMISVICVFLIFIGQRLIFKDKPAKIFGVYTFEVISDSMYKEGDPNCIEKGALVFVIKNKTYEEGMVISYQVPGETIPTTHQITKVDGSNITTKGINNTSGGDSEETFDAQYVLGEVKLVWHNFASVKAFVTNPLTIVGIVVIFVGGFVCVYLFGKDKEKDTGKNH